jgi:hypothetical protein
MSRNNLESVVGKENVNKIVSEIEVSIGEIRELKQVGGGLVHYVYKVTTNSQTAYLKIRANHYSGIPNISTQPELIGNEKRALELFSINSGEYFPEILLYNSVFHYLLLSDVMPGGITLDRMYRHGNVEPIDLYQLGYSVGSIHSDTRTSESVRYPSDEQYQSNLMKYALESYNHPTLMKAAQEHRRRNTQLLIGDLSPKNIYIRDGIVRLCDLENAHQGVLPYDQAFIIAHILLHHKSLNTAIAAMWAFIDGYESSESAVDQGDALVSQTLHGILLYRLDNPVIPYELPFKSKQRKQMAKNVFLSLGDNVHDLEVVAANLFDI